jgi:hypothetical protein
LCKYASPVLYFYNQNVLMCITFELDECVVDITQDFKRLQRKGITNTRKIQQERRRLQRRPCVGEFKTVRPAAYYRLCMSTLAPTIPRL